MTQFELGRLVTPEIEEKAAGERRRRKDNDRSMKTKK